MERKSDADHPVVVELTAEEADILARFSNMDSHSAASLFGSTYCVAASSVNPAFLTTGGASTFMDDPESTPAGRLEMCDESPRLVGVAEEQIQRDLEDMRRLLVAADAAVADHSYRNVENSSCPQASCAEDEEEPLNRSGDDAEFDLSPAEIAQIKEEAEKLKAPVLSAEEQTEVARIAALDEQRLQRMSENYRVVHAAILESVYAPESRVGESAVSAEVPSANGKSSEERPTEEAKRVEEKQTARTPQTIECAKETVQRNLEAVLRDVNISVSCHEEEVTPSPTRVADVVFGSQAQCASAPPLCSVLLSNIEQMLPAATVDPAELGLESSAPACHGEGAAIGGAQLTLKQILRRSERAMALLKREARESVAMEREDLLGQRIVRKHEADRMAREREMVQLTIDEEKKRNEVTVMQGLGRADIAGKELRQREVIRQFLVHRHAEAIYRKIGDLVHEEEEAMQALARLEGEAWIDIARDQSTERTELVLRLAEQARKAEEERLKKVLEQKLAAKKEWEASVEAYQSNSEKTISAALHSTKTDQQSDEEHFLAVSFTCRATKLGGQLQLHTDWAREAVPSVTLALQALNSVPRFASMSTGRKSSFVKSEVPQRTASASCSDATTDSLKDDVVGGGGTRLGVAILRKHLSRFVNAVVPSCFKLGRIRIVLEGIETIDYEELGKLRADNGALLAPGVLGLDLSSNSLKRIDATKLCAALPNVVRLAFRDNKLDCVFSTGDQQQLLSVLWIDVASNSVSSLDGLVQFPNLHTLCAFSNRISSSIPLAHCKHLQVIELSRNSLTEVEGVASLPLLRLLDCSRNNISSLAPLARCPLLERIYASNNRLSSIPAGSLPLVFLRQLFLNDNELVEFPEIGWMPHLSTLHLESNHLQRFTGVSGCLMLSTLHLAFNSIHDRRELRSLFPLKRLRTLSLSDNPITTASNDKQEIRQLLLGTLPALAELDNEVVTAREKGDASLALLKERCEYDSVALLAQMARRVRGMSSTAAFVTGVAAEGRFAASAASVARGALLLGRNDSRESEVAYEFDAMIQHMQWEHDAELSAQKRMVQDAECNENRLLIQTQQDDAALTARSATQYSCLSLERGWQESEYQHMLLAQQHLLNLREPIAPHSKQSGMPLRDVHFVSKTYLQRAKLFAEGHSREIIAQWLYRLILRRRAVAQLSALRNSAHNLRLRALAKAAQVIQPVWRGAWTRMRLARARMPDDDETFQPVSIDEQLSHLGSTAAATTTVTSLFQRAMVQLPRAPQFAIPDAPIPARDEPQRTSSASTQRLPHEGSSDVAPTPPRPASMSARDGSRGVASASQGMPCIDEQWGASLAAQIHKRDKKMQRQRSDQARKEYLTDPLKNRRK